MKQTTPWHSGLGLRVIEGPGLGQIFHLNEEKLMVGRARAEGATAPGWVLLPDRAVSRHHATLLWQMAEGRFLLCHNSDTNLTWLNGEVVENQPIQAGDQIKMGLVLLEVLAVDPATAPVVTAPAPAAPPTPAHISATVESTKPMRKTMGLQVGGGFQLRLEGGPDGPTSVALEGLVITIGRGNQQPEPSQADPNPLVFDRMIELQEPQLGANHFIFRWKETQQAFDLWKRPGLAPVAFVRRQDGFEWHAWLSDQGVVLREGDRFTVGSTIFTLERPSSEGKKSIKL